MALLPIESVQVDNDEKWPRLSADFCDGTALRVWQPDCIPARPNYSRTRTDDRMPCRDLQRRQTATAFSMAQSLWPICGWFPQHRARPMVHSDGCGMASRGIGNECLQGRRHVLDAQ